MLRLIIGRASSGKTTYIRNILSENATRGKHILLIVPEQFSLESEKAIIELLGAKNAGNVKMIFSFTSLARHILDEHDKNRKPFVTEAAKAVIMSMALESLEEHLNIFKNCKRNKKTVSELLHMTDELIQCDVDSTAMRAAAENSGSSVLLKKTEELQLIAEAYETLLTAHFSDDRYMINRAAELAAEKKLFADTIVVLDEFSGFTAQENLLIAEALKQAEDVYITMCADGIRDHSGGTGAFSYSVRSINRLIALANKSNVRVAEPVLLTRPHAPNAQALAFLEKGVYTPDPDIYGGDAPEITVAAAKNPYDECDFAAMSAKKLVREKGLRYRDIVIVSRNADYEKYMPFALQKYDIPIFEDRRRSLENELIVIFASCALTLAAEGFTTDRMMQYLKTFISGIDEDSIAALENYVLIWQIDRSQWIRDWTGHPDGFGNEFDEDAERRLEELNNIRKTAVFPIIKLKEALTDSDGYGCTKAIYDFLISVHADKNLLQFALESDEKTALDCEKSWDEFMDMLSLLADTVGHRNLTPTRYLELFKIMAAASEIGDIPSGIDCITVGDADRIRVTDKKVLFILGANEGVFPAAARGSFVITENERRLLLNSGLELGDGSIEKIKKERLRVYSTVSIPEEMLFISYSTASFDGQTLAPSEIVTMADKIVPRHNRAEIAFLDPVDTVESGRSAFESAAMHFSDNTAYAASIKAFIAEQAEYSDMMNAVERAAEKSPFAFENAENAKALFGKDIYITPSRVENYNKCPFQYFCRYGLRAAPLNKAAFDPRQNGLLIHCVLEKLFAKYGSKELCNLSKTELKKAVEDEADRYILTYMGSTETLSRRMQYALERSKKTVTEILMRLTNEFSGSKFETRDVELKIGIDGAIPPYSVNVPDGGKAIINGIVDRVDTMASEKDGKTYLRVIDYKTGGKDFNLADVLSGLNIQMLVYLMCLFENGQDRYGRVIPAGVLYVPAKKGTNTLGRHANSTEIEQARIAQGKMKGIVLSDPEVIYGMEENGGGLIIDAKIDKNGAVKGKIFDMHQFELLHKAVDDAIAQMALSLHRGRIEAVPILDGVYKNTCDYCDYKAVCCREDGDDRRALYKGDIWEALEAIYHE